MVAKVSSSRMSFSRLLQSRRDCSLLSISSSILTTRSWIESLNAGAPSQRRNCGNAALHRRLQRMRLDLLHCGLRGLLGSSHSRRLGSSVYRGFKWLNGWYLRIEREQLNAENKQTLNINLALKKPRCNFFFIK